MGPVALEPFKVLSLDAMGTLLRLRENPAALYGRFVRDMLGLKFHPSERAFLTAYKHVQQQAPCFGYGSRNGARGWWTKVVEMTLQQAPGWQEVCAQKKVDVPSLTNAIYDHYATPEPWELVETDLIDTLSELKQQLGVLVVITSNFDSRLRSISEAFGIAPHVDVFQLSGELWVEKPDPEIFKRTLRHFGAASNPSQLLHIGDDVEKDYLASKRASAQALLFSDPQEGQKRRREKVPDEHCIDSFRRLLCLCEWK